MPLGLLAGDTRWREPWKPVRPEPRLSSWPDPIGTFAPGDRPNGTQRPVGNLVFGS